MNKEISDQAFLKLVGSIEEIQKQYLLDVEELLKRECECAEEKHLTSMCPKTELKGFKLLAYNLKKLWK